MSDFIQDDLKVFVVPVEILDRDDLTTHEKMVYITLRSYANPHEPQAFPSYATIAKKGSMSRRQAIRCVESLVQKGIIRKEIRMTVTKKREIKQTSNLYHIGRPYKKQGGDSQSLGGVTESHRGSDSQSPEHNHMNITNTNMDGRKGDQPLKNGNNTPHTEKQETANSDLLHAKKEWNLFRGLCEKEGLDERTTLDLWKVYQHQYRHVPITHAMAVLRDLLYEKWDNRAKAFYGMGGVEFKNFVGLFHHRMKTANEMAVAIEDIQGGKR